MMRLIMLLLSLASLGDCFLSPTRTQKVVSLLKATDTSNGNVVERRTLLATTFAFLGVSTAVPLANAGIDPAALRSLSVEGDVSGAAARLRQLEAIQKPATDTEDKPWTDLSSGVSYREYREGKGEAGMKANVLSRLLILSRLTFLRLNYSCPTWVQGCRGNDDSMQVFFDGK